METVAPYLEILIFISVIIGFSLSLYLAKQLGQGVMNVIFYSFSIGTLLVGLSRLFLFLADQGFYQFHDVTLHIWWHTIFYFGMLAFIWGGKRLKDVASSPNPKPFNGDDALLLGSLLALSVIIYIFAPALDSSLLPMLVGSMVDKLGLHHFGAVILAGVTASYIYYIKANWGKLLGVSVFPILIFLTLMSLQHLWELLTESWQVISLSSEVIEGVEQLIVLPALVSLSFGLWRVAKFLNMQLKPDSATAKLGGEVNG